MAGASYAYGAYGEPLTPAGALAWGGSRYRYTGQIEIPEARLYHDKARAYDPGLGRFVQIDPAGYADNLNASAYVGDDPVNDFDPTGLATGQVTDPGLVHYTGGPEGLSPPEELVVTANRQGFGTHGASTLATPAGVAEKHEAPTEELVVTAKKLTYKTAKCVFNNFGLNIAGLGFSAAGLPIISTGVKTGGATPGTSLASRYSRQILGGTRLPFKVYAPTFKVLANDVVRSVSEGGLRLSEGAVTNLAGKAVGRAIPFVGEALLAYDAVSIAACVAGN